MSSLLSEDGRSVVDTSKADSPVWLMKCPPVLARSWQLAASRVPESTSPTGYPLVSKVVVTLDPLITDQSSKFQFKMDLARNEIGNTPKSYSLNMFRDFVPMEIFGESKGKCSLEGKVDHKFDMEPHSENFGEYGKLCRERTNKAMIKTRQTQILSADDRGQHMRPQPGMVGLTPVGSKEKRKVAPTKVSDTKRTRRDRRELENIIFKLFERQPNWALKQLVKETDQPEQFLKEILSDLCVYNKRGPNQGTHELKPEYKKSSEETDAGS